MREQSFTKPLAHKCTAKCYTETDGRHLKRCTHGFIKMYARTPVIREEFQGYYERTIISHQTGLRENAVHCRGLKKETHFNQKPEQEAARVSCVVSLSHTLLLSSKARDRQSKGIRRDAGLLLVCHLTPKQYHEGSELFPSLSKCVCTSTRLYCRSLGCYR